jgi:hypothetical protein
MQLHLARRYFEVSSRAHRKKKFFTIFLKVVDKYFFILVDHAGQVVTS